MQRLMLRSNLHILPDDIEITVENGTTISEALQNAGIILGYPCGGKGTCGRCIVIANDVPVKACNTCIEHDLEITIPEAVRLAGQSVLTNIRLYAPEQNVLPLLEKISLTLEKPTLTDSRNDIARLKEALSKKLKLKESMIWFESQCLKDLPKVLRKNDFNICVNLVHEFGGVTVLSFSDKPNYGVAVDVGTTTMAVALCDLATGEVLDTVGAPNPQAAFGSDVISRIVYSEEDDDGLETLQKSVLDSLSDMILTLAHRFSIETETISVVVVAANTTMSHFLLGYPADYLRRDPYVPLTNEYPVVRPSMLNLPILPWGRVVIISSVSSYVGGDIVAGVIATGIDKTEGINMLVDVGTNGEMVLAGEGFMVACSCSAGPAFEGSGISCGSRAVHGAIDNIYYKDGQLLYEVIGGSDVEPTSICGSGFISLLSALLQKGIINRSGRFTTDEKLYKITPTVSITEPDVLHLVRSKGAIFAGMRVLVRHMDLKLSDINKFLIAGGFGRNLNIEHAADIGMFPPADKELFEYVGNSSLAGALRVLNDRTINYVDIASSIMNFELSVGNEFMDEFTKACFLPHTDSNLME